MKKSKVSEDVVEGFIRLANIAVFTDYLKERGIQTASVFEEHGLSEASVGDASVFVHAEIVYGLTNAFSDVIGDKYLGIHVGEDFNFSAWSPFAAAATSSKTLVEFFANFIRRVPTEVNSVAHNLSIEPDRAVYKVRRFQEPVVQPLQVTGFGCAQNVRLLRAVAGSSWDPSQVTFKSRHILGVPTRYLGIDTQLSPSSGLEFSFPVEWLFRDLELDFTIAEGDGRQSTQEVTVIAALRSVLTGHLDQPDLSPRKIAALLGVEKDRLIRAMKQNNTTLAKEVKRLKTDLAKDMLREDGRTIAQIGASLGYGDNAHFTRFFRSQTGVTPSAFRAEIKSMSDRSA